MIVNRDTWHYRWYRYWNEHRTASSASLENLCHYVWTLILWAPLTWLGERLRGVDRWLRGNESWLGKLIAIAVVAYVVGLLAFVGYMIYSYPLVSVLLIGGMAGAIILVIVATVIYSLMEDRLSPMLKAVGDTVQLAGEYLSAKKRRICPFIEFSGSEKDH